MEIKIQKTVTINDETDWLRVAPPKGKNRQWKNGYSAKELAKFATSSDFKVWLEKLTLDTVNDTNFSFICEPEAETSLPPESAGGPRNHDLLLVDKDKKLLIGLEAKIHEDIGKSLSAELINASLNKKDRIDWLVKTLIDKNKCALDFPDLKYQLFTGLGGTMIEARNRGIDKCIFEILPIRVSNVKDKNWNAFQDFCKAIQLNRDGYICREIYGKEIKCWVKYKGVAIMDQVYVVGD